MKRGQYEAAPTVENVRSFQTYTSNRTISFYKTQFKSLYHIYVYAREDTGRGLRFSHCDINNCTIETELYANTLILLSLQIDHGSMSYTTISVEGWSPNSLIYLKMINMQVFDVHFVQYPDASAITLGLHTENSTWVNRFPFVEFSHRIGISIVSSQLTSNCHSCTLMDIKGVGYIAHHSSEWYFLNSIHPSHRDNRSFIYMIDTTFATESSPLNIITTERAKMTLVNSTLIIKQIIQFNVQHFEARNVLLECATGKLAEPTFGKSDIVFSCKPPCEGKSEYSLQEGKLIITNGLFMYGAPSVWLTEVNPCLPCPIGAKCVDGIQALPNYWGYRDTETSVSLERCPDGYCCHGKETCTGIDSCNTGRTGTLCGKCQDNLSESIFTPQCVPFRSCRSGLVTTLFVSAALIYAIVLLSFSAIKSNVTKFATKLYTLCKAIFKKEKVNKECTNKKQTAEDPNTEDMGLKYIQILLYYVQDSKLFTIQLPRYSWKLQILWLGS